jgi:hypothetical protein
MGSHCSRPAQASAPIRQEVSILLDYTAMVQANPNRDVVLMRKTLRRNSTILKKRIATYEEKLKTCDQYDPRGKIFTAERDRAIKLLAEIRHIGKILNYME